MVKENARPVKVFGSLILKATKPPVVESFNLIDLSSGVTPINVTIDPAIRQVCIDGVKANMGYLQETDDRARLYVGFVADR